MLRAGKRVRITAQLIDAMRDRLLWAESYEHDLDDVLALQSRVARAIAGRIELELTPQERVQPGADRPGESRGPRGLPEGASLLVQAHDGERAQGPGVLRGGGQPRSVVRPGPRRDRRLVHRRRRPLPRGLSRRGLRPGAGRRRCRRWSWTTSLAEAHTSLAAVMTDYDWDWEGADREYRRAIELNPNYVTAHSWYAEQLSRMGRHDEAVAEARRARELDPLSLVSSMIVSWILYFARRYDEAIEWAPQHPGTRSRLRHGPPHPRLGLRGDRSIRRGDRGPPAGQRPDRAAAELRGPARTRLRAGGTGPGEAREVLDGAARTVEDGSTSRPWTSPSSTRPWARRTAPSTGSNAPTRSAPTTCPTSRSTRRLDSLRDEPRFQTRAEGDATGLSVHPTE